MPGQLARAGRLLLIAGLSAPFAAAQEPAPYDPVAGTAWTQGERVRLEVSQEERGRHAMGDAVREVQTVTAATLHLSVSEVGEHGRLRAAELRVERFTQRRGAGEEVGVEPVTVRLVCAAGPEGRLGVQPPAAGAPPLARPLALLLSEVAGWLDPALDGALLQGQPMHAGTEWRPAPEALARAFVPAGGDVEAGPAEESLTLRLTIEGDAVRVEGRGPLPLRTLPGARGARVDGPLESTLELRAEWPRARCPSRGGKLEATYRFQGAALNRLPDGKEQRITASQVRGLKLAIAPE